MYFYFSFSIFIMNTSDSYYKPKYFSDLTIIAIIVTSDLTIIAIIVTSDLTIIAIIATPRKRYLS